MVSIVDLTNSRGDGTFKFQYSLYQPVIKERFIPKNKKRAEEMLFFFLTETLKRNYIRNISGVKSPADDSYKKADMLMQEDDMWRGIQISQLQFTDYERRKAISQKMNELLAKSIWGEGKARY